MKKAVITLALIFLITGCVNNNPAPSALSNGETIAAEQSEQTDGKITDNIGSEIESLVVDAEDDVLQTDLTENGSIINITEGGIVGSSYFGADSFITDVISHPAFDGFGRLILPANTGYYSGSTLRELSLTWYANIVPDKTVEIVNYMKNSAEAGNTIFYDIYTDAEKVADPAKQNTGLFFFKGTPGERFAICNAGGGFAFVGAMHDSFPHALELSKKGYNAFALIYRPGAQTACEDLARAIGFIFENADELEVDTDDYSLWGGSAGARMAAYLGSHGAAAYGGGNHPRAGAVIMQYTAHSDYTRNDPPTFVVTGENDGIASWRSMEQRVNNLKAAGIDTEFYIYPNLGHGFGLGIGTTAEGWFENAVAFWEKHISN